MGTGFTMPAAALAVAALAAACEDAASAPPAAPARAAEKASAGPGAPRSEAAAPEPASPAARAVPPLAPRAAKKGDHYAVEAEISPARVAAHGKAALSLRITPQDGYKLNREYPLRIAVSAKGALEAERDALKLSDAKDGKAGAHVWTVGLSAKEAGEGPVQVDARFSICTPQICLMRREALALGAVVE